MERLGLMGWAGARVARRGVGSCGEGWEMRGLRRGCYGYQEEVG